MKIAINAISATTGGARTYLLNLARALPSLGRHEYQLYIPGSAAPDLAGLPGDFELLQNARAERSYVQRLVWEQSTLPRRVSRWSQCADLHGQLLPFAFFRAGHSSEPQRPVLYAAV